MERKLTNNTANMYKVTGLIDNTILENKNNDIEHLLDIAVLEIL